MGLTLKAVNKDYGFKKVIDEDGDYEYLEKETNEEYLSTDIGYVGFMSYRTEIAKFFGIEKYYEPSLYGNPKGFLGEFGVYFYNSNDYGLLYSEDEADEEDLQHPKFNEYMQKMARISKEKYYNILPLLLHSDCDGEMPLRDVKRIYPKIKEFHEKCRKSNVDFGYSGWDYSFINDFEKILELCIKNQGKLIFS